MITYGSTTLTSYNTITKIEVYYYKSTSSTDLAGGSWSTTKPTWENGKYIWQKIRTTYEGKLANGQFYSESDPVNITGQQGATGTAAYSYKLNASDTIVGRTKTGQYTVNEITFTATYKQGTGAVTAYAGRFKIETTLNGTDWTTAVSSTVNESSKKFTIPENIIAIKCSLYQAGGLTVLLDIMTVPIVKDGVDAIGLRDTIPYYLASDKDTGVTRDEVGWSRYTPQLTADKKYLWVYYASRYSEGNSEPELIDIKDDVVSFENHGEISPSEGCVVDINPVQDCNGYDKPWIRGTGNNKLPSPKEETIILNGITAYCDGAGKYTLTGTATAVTTIKFNLDQTFTIPPSTETNLYLFNTQAFSNGKVKWAFWNNTSTVDTWSLSSINRNSTNYSGMANKSCNTVGFTITSGTVVDMALSPALLLKGNTTFESYENICPITGWTGAKVTRAGKNLIPISTLGNDPQSHWGGNWEPMVDYLNTLDIGTYTIAVTYEVVEMPGNGKVEHGRIYITAMVNGSQVPVTRYSTTTDTDPTVGKTYRDVGTFAITEANKGKIYRCYTYCDQSQSHTGNERGKYLAYDIQLELGTTATAYEPYKGQDYIYDVRFDDNLSLIKTDNEPYQFRQNIVPTAFQVDRLEDEIVGGSIIWNQCATLPHNRSANGISVINNNDGSCTINGTATNEINSFASTAPWSSGHVYYLAGFVHGVKLYIQIYNDSTWVKNFDMRTLPLIRKIADSSIANTVAVSLYITSGTSFDNITFKPQIFDLTQMFGSTVADYIYNLEQNEAGTGVAWFRKYFPNEYYEYNAGEIKSVEELQSRDMVGFNAWDEEWEVGSIIDLNGQPTASGKSTDVIRTKNYNSCLPNATYYVNKYNNSSGAHIYAVYLYDADKNYIGMAPISNITRLFTTPSNCRYFKFRTYIAYGTTYKNDICINLSCERDGEYEPYINHSYPLDSSLILRGIPKLSSEGNLYYDGDRYKSDGTVTRKYGIVDLGTLTWYYTSTSTTPRFHATVSGCKKVSGWYGIDSLISISKYTRGDNVGQTADAYNKWGVYSGVIYITDSSYTDATSFKTAMSGVYLVYELATPTTEKGSPYQSPQIIDPYGTEEYVTNSIVPVGHETKYYSRAVYGGQLDMTNGILTVDRARLTLTGDPTKEAWYLYAPANYNADCFSIAIPNKKIGHSTSICDKFSNIIVCWGANGDNKYGVYSDHPTLNRFYFRQPNANVTTVDEWKEWLSENPVTVCYELADPIIYQLTPQELTMLAGQNYVYSDSGQTNIRYYDDQTSTEPRIDYTFMSAYDTAQMINNAVGTLEAPYTELEWVESTGKQYVYLDWKPPIKTWGFEADFICRNLIGATGANVWNEETNVDGYGSVFGVRNASQVNDCLLTSYASGVVRIGGGNISDIGFERNKRIVMKMHDTTFTKPDGTTKTLTRLNETANKPYWNMTVFAYHQGLRQAGYGSVTEPSSTRIYSLKFFDGDTLTVDLVGAIRKSDRITGLYDKVSKHFYPAPGLLYGNEVGDIGEIASIKQSMLKTNPQTIVVNKNRTRMWEATVPFDHLEDGQKLTVTYSYGNVVSSIETEKLAGWTDTSSNQQIYLKLTLSNGNQTDWIPCYYSNTGRLTTHYGSGIPIVFTYRENMLAGASETSSGYAVMRGFYADANYDSNTIYTQYASAVKAGTNGVKRYTLIMRDSDNTYSSFINQANTLGTTKTAYTGGFVLGKIYYSSGGTEYATGANTSSIWSTYQVDLRYDFNITTSGATALTLYKPVYLVGTVHDDDGLFYLDTAQWWTQTEPTSEDGKVYVFVGQAYSAYQSWLTVDNTAYQYYDGKFMPYETVRTLKSITTLQETLENQIDGKVETWCQINDPATAWTTADLKNQHDGDLWYYIGESNTTYKNNTTYKYTASTGKWTAYSASTDLFDRIDSKSTVYYGKPSAVTQNLEVGDYLVDNTDGCSYRWDGSKWVKLTDYKTAIDNIEIGGRNYKRNSNFRDQLNRWSTWNGATVTIDENIENKNWAHVTMGTRTYGGFSWELGKKTNADPMPIISGNEITIAFDAQLIEGEGNAVLWLYYRSTEVGGNLVQATQKFPLTEITSRFSHTFVIPSHSTNTIDTICVMIGIIDGTIKQARFTNIKVEKGNKVTDWTPAPEDVTRGTGFYSITTAPTAYTTTISGFTPSYRIALSTVKSESGLEEVMIGDVIQQGYNTYPVGYVDASYVYLGSANSIRGATGATGLNNAQVILYRRFASAPSGTDIAPTGDVTYTFATGKAVNNLNSWTQNIPSGTNPVYMIAASASNTSATDVIPKTEWSAPVKILENGQNGGAGSAGADGYNQATIFLYQRKSGTAPSKPSSAVTYTFSSGALSSTPTGWSRTIPTNDGNPCYVTTATAIAKTATYSIPANGWSDVVILSQNGEDGTSITITSTSVKYQKGTSGTTAPTGTWGTSIPSVGENEFLWTQTIVNYSDSSKTESYSVSRNAKNGTNGTSPTVSSTTVEYQQSTGGTTPPTGTWATSAPTATAGQYMWTRTTVTYSDNKTAVSYSVSKNGTNGTSPTAYHLIVSHGAINKSQAGVYNPTTITLTSKSQTGNGALNNYSGRFKIETTTDNSTWTQDSASSTANESSKTYTIPANIKAVRFSLYLAGGFTTLLDQQTVPIVIDGAKGDSGDDAYTIVLTNEAHTFPAGASAALAGSATSSVMTYKGGTQVACFVGSTSSATSISTGTTGLTCAINNNNSKNVSLTFTATTSLTTRAGTVTIPITVDNKSFSKTFTWSLANQGAKGDNGVSVTNVTSTNNTADGGTSVVTVTLSDGTTKTFNVKNGSKGNPGATGATAQWYYGIALTHTSGTATLVATSTSGAVVGSMYLNTQTSLVYKCTAVGTNNTWTYAGDLTTGVIDNIQIGGKNLLLKDPRGFDATAYNAYKLDLTEPLIAGQTYTIQLWNVDVYNSKKTESQLGVTVYYCGSSVTFGYWMGTQYFTDGHADHLTLTFTPTEANVTHSTVTNTTGAKYISLYNSAPYVSDSVESLTIEKWQLEKGNIATDWTPAIEDTENAIQSAQSRADEAWAATQPIMSKTYENVTITANNDPKGWLYFGTVKPTNYYVPWKIRYKLHAYINGITDSHQQSEVMIEGAKNTYYAYRTYNMIANTNYRPVYAYSLYTLKEAGVNNNYGHLIGIRFQSAYWPDNNFTNYGRTVEIEIIESTNCTVSFADEMFLYTDAPGTGGTNYYNRYSFDGTTQGYTGSGDRNETNHLLNNFSGKTGVLGIWSAGLFMRDGDGTYQNICTNSAGAISRTVDTTKKPNPNGFEIGSQIYYSPWNAYNANSNINGSVYASYGAFDSRYSLNTTLTNNCLTPYEPVYLVGTVRTDGLYYLDTVWWTQTPTDSSKTYVLIGGCYDSTTSYCRINLYEENNWYKYVNGKLEDYTNRLAELASTTATAYITDTTDNGIMVHPESDTTSGWSIAGAIELFKSGISYIKLWIDNNIPKIRIGKEDQGHLILDNDSVDIMENANDNLASFGKETSIGGENSSCLILSPNEIAGQYKDGNESFHIYNYYTTKTGEKDITENQKIFPYNQSNNGNTFRYALQNAPVINPEGTINIIVIGYNNNKEEIASASQTLEYKYFYDSSNNPIRLTVNGEVFEEWTYDADGNLIEVNEYQSAIEGISYDVSGKRPKTGDIFDITYEPFSGRYVVVTTSSNITSINLQVNYTTQAEVQIPNPYYTFGSRLGISQGSYSFAVGKNNIASAECSVALGAGCKADADYSYAEGDHTTASGSISHAEGSYTYAYGDKSHAEGSGAIANGECSHAEGSSTQANGKWSHAEGNYTQANGMFSHAEGHYTQSNGHFSHAQGYKTIASSDYQASLGQYNIEDTNDIYSVIIGNGTSNNNRSNALTVSWEGNVEMALDTTASSGTTDADLYNAITALGWENDILI